MNAALLPERKVLGSISDMADFPTALEEACSTSGIPINMGAGGPDT